MSINDPPIFIDDLIRQLEEIKRIYGNLPVIARDAADRLGTEFAVPMHICLLDCSAVTGAHAVLCFAVTACSGLVVR